ncbi:MAG: type II toxin-antitoxin system ParD family antitoxin [Thermodesulfobacteriota bacterium]
MTLEIAPDIEEMVRTVFQGGGYASQSAVLREAVSLLGRRDRLKRDLQQAIEEIERGDSIDGEDLFRELELQLLRHSHQEK